MAKHNPSQAEIKTKTQDQVIRFLLKIAQTAVKAQTCIGTEECDNLLDDIQYDLQQACNWHESLLIINGIHG